MENSTDRIVYQHITSFPELNSENVLEWLWNLETALRLGQVWDPIFARDPRGLRPVPPNEDEPAYEEYHALASKACVWIMLAGRYENSRITKEFDPKKDAVGMYDAIVEKYAPRTLVNRFKWYKRMRACQEEPKKNAGSTTRMRNILENMNLISPCKDSPKDFFNELAMFAILNTLHPHCPLFLQLIVDDGATFESVKAAIMQAEAHYPDQLIPQPDAIMFGEEKPSGNSKKSKK